MLRKGWIVLVGLFGLAQGQAPDPLRILNQMLDRTGSLRTLSYELKKYERIRGKLVMEHLRFKLRRQPFAVYGYQFSPRKGVEVLYPAEPGSTKVLVKPNTFPYVALTLDPYGDLILEDQHQTLFSAGYDQIRSLLLAAKEKYQTQLPRLVRYDGTLVWDGRRCYKLTLTPPAYQIGTYTVQAGETLFRIAEKLRVGWYKIMELNGFSSPNVSLKEGQVLRVPSDYGKVIRLSIDAERHIPLVVEVEDEQGVYERYEYYGVEVDLPLTDTDFSRKNPAYRF
jgi:LysM repeat protein